MGRLTYTRRILVSEMIKRRDLYSKYELENQVFNKKFRLDPEFRPKTVPNAKHYNRKKEKQNDCKERKWNYFE